MLLSMLFERRYMKFVSEVAGMVREIVYGCLKAADAVRLRSNKQRTRDARPYKQRIFSANHKTQRHLLY